VRSYNVGFGDCFLLTFTYAKDDPRQILIDFGSTKSSSFGPASLLPIAEKIKEDCGGKLDMVVATHRHTDHISGFGGKPGRVIASLEPEIVVQPWTEDPELEPDAQAPVAAGDGRLRAQALVTQLSDMQRLAATMLADCRSSRPRRSCEDRDRAGAFLGETNIKTSWPCGT
jgi:glyoxylase-like metal-dependent hydrolase (beta-lactamase superfamily II)